MATIVVVCCECGTRLTGELRLLDSLPPYPEFATPCEEPRIPAGQIAVGAEAWDEQGARRPVANPADLVDVQPHPDGTRHNGCCAEDGLDGPNLVCATCGAQVATLRNDCWLPDQVHFEPDRVRLEAVAGDSPAT